MTKKTHLRKIFNGVQIVLLAVVLIMALTAEFAYYEQYEYEYEEYIITDGSIGYGEKYDTRITLIKDPEAYAAKEPIAEGSIGFGEMYNGQPIYGTVAIAFIVFCIIVSIASLIRNTVDRDGFLHILLPMITTAAFFLFVLMGVNGAACLDENYFTIFESNKNLFMTVFFILLAVTLISFIKRSKLLNPTETVTVEVISSNTQTPTEADELAKYKALLDSGAITEEEYNEKKKQLLGL